jgi:excisionase family DNA binding protein
MKNIGYTIREAAKLRRVHPHTVRRQILKGEIKAQSIRGFIYLIPSSEIRKIKVRPAHDPKRLAKA